MKLRNGIIIDSDSARYKFGGDRMAEYLYDLSLVGLAYDESTGTTEWDVWVARYGRRFLCEDGQGNVWQTKFPTVGDAVREFETIERDYANWEATDVIDNEWIDAMVNGYAECAVWAGLDWSPVELGKDNNPRPLDDNYDVDDISPEAWTSIRDDCRAFARDNAADLVDIAPGQAGHDFYLTRNGHGAGFWDRGLGDVGERLTQACRPYGSSDLMVCDDGRLYVE